MEPKKPSISPNDFDSYVNPIADIYQALEEHIFQLIAKRLKAPRDMDSDRILEWQVEKLQQIRTINQETIKELAKATGLAEKEIRKTIEEVGFKTIESVDNELEYHFEPRPIPNHINTILAAYVNQTFRDLNNFVNQTLITTNYGEGTVANMYRKIVEESTAKVLAGTMTVSQAIAETVIKWANKGIESGFVDRGGRVWSLEAYARSVIRSTVNRTYNELRMSRMDEYGIHLVLMSSHSHARPACAPIQGTVVSTERVPRNSKYKSIYDYGYGEPWGVRGINCTHIFYPFIEGVNINNQPQYDEEKAVERYKLTQKQRYYERQIRKAKQALMLAEEVGDEETIQKYKSLIRSRQARLREYIAQHDLPRFRSREQVYAGLKPRPPRT